MATIPHEEAVWQQRLAALEGALLQRLSQAGAPRALLTRLAEGRLEGPHGARPLRTALGEVLREEGWQPLPIKSDDHA